MLGNKKAHPDSEWAFLMLNTSVFYSLRNFCAGLATAVLLAW